MAKKPIPLPLPIEEEKCEECPKCPPVGAPAWMATFADMATLLMAFFVLILSFAEFNSPKFKMISGSLKNAFGIQRISPVVEQPRGTTVLELKFSPNPSPSVTEEMKQDTTQVEAPKVDTKTKEEGDTGQDGETQNSKDGTSDGQTEADKQAEALQQALSEALSDGAVSATVKDGEVVLEFSAEADADTQELQEQLKEAAQAMQQAEAQTGQSTTDVLMAGLSQHLQQLANTSPEGTETGATGQSQGDGSGGANGDVERKAQIAESTLQVALQQEIDQGLVQVERKDGKVFVTVGAGGSFTSGSADLTQEAREIMSRIAFSAMQDTGSITVTGHTDDVPVSSGSEFRDNWGLAAARSASVVREFAGSGLIDPTQLQAVSMGESDPVADNTTAEGREQNRRIEIEINYE